MSYAILIQLMPCVIGCAIGGYYLKLYADAGSSDYFLVSASAYLLANFYYAGILRSGEGFAYYGVIYAALSLLMTVVIGYFIFNERFSASQYAGMVLAFTSMLLMAIKPQ